MGRITYPRATMRERKTDREREREGASFSSFIWLNYTHKISRMKFLQDTCNSMNSITLRGWIFNHEDDYGDRNEESFFSSSEKFKNGEIDEGNDHDRLVKYGSGASTGSRG